MGSHARVPHHWHSYSHPCSRAPGSPRAAVLHAAVRPPTALRAGPCCQSARAPLHLSEPFLACQASPSAAPPLKELTSLCCSWCARHCSCALSPFACCQLFRPARRRPSRHCEPRPRTYLFLSSPLPACRLLRIGPVRQLALSPAGLPLSRLLLRHARSFLSSSPRAVRAASSSAAAASSSATLTFPAAIGI